MKNIKKFSLMVAFLGILIVPNFTSAATVEELQAQISALLAQLQSLQAQLNQVQGTTQTWCHNFDVNLKFGDSGNEVEALQRALEKEGLAPSKDWDMRGGEGYRGIEYYFGELTASAVSGFQEKYKDEILAPLGLKYGTGFVGKSTRAKLNALYGCGVKPRPEPPAKCPQYTPPLCKEGEKIISGGYDERGCPLPGKCVSVTTPSITVLSPNGGEKWEVGKTYEIKWTNKNSVKGVNNLVRIILRDYTSGNYQIISNNVLSPDNSINSYQWTIPDSINSGSYKIHIEYTDITECPSSVVCYNDDSDAPFSIVAAGTPSITVLSPNGGEVWEIGKTYTIKWTSANLPADGLINIELIDQATTRAPIRIFTEITNDGVENWTVKNPDEANHLTPGIYKIYIFATPSSRVDWIYAEDFSDAPFSIVATPVGQTQTLNQMANVLESAREILEKISTALWR